MLTKNEYTVSDKGEQITVELNSNFDFDVKMPQVDWITTTVTRSVSSHTLYYTIVLEMKLMTRGRPKLSIMIGMINLWQNTLKDCPGAERCDIVVAKGIRYYS